MFREYNSSCNPLPQTRRKFPMLIPQNLHCLLHHTEYHDTDGLLDMSSANSNIFHNYFRWKPKLKAFSLAFAEFIYRYQRVCNPLVLYVCLENFLQKLIELLSSIDWIIYSDLVYVAFFCYLVLCLKSHSHKIFPSWYHNLLHFTREIYIYIVSVFTHLKPAALRNRNWHQQHNIFVSLLFLVAEA